MDIVMCEVLQIWWGEFVLWKTMQQEKGWFLINDLLFNFIIHDNSTFLKAA